jgi:Ser-tRNA(Ala) deacylase AlaX
MEEPKKTYYEPMHTAEHILNQTMVRMFGCGRSRNAHIERKKSKCDYLLAAAPSEAQINAIAEQVNAVIASHLPVSISFVPKEEASDFLDLSKLPEDAGDMVRVVRVGDYDACACIGMHVNNTSEIGKFVILTHDYQEGVWRMRFKLEQQGE